jgi:hypothetical protein
VSSFISLLAFMLFSLWFGRLGVSYLDRNAAVKLCLVIFSICSELIFFLNALPALTLGVVSLIIVSRFEDGKSKLFYKAKKRHLLASQAQRDQAMIQVQSRFNRDEQSRAFEEVRERGGTEPLASADFASGERPLKERRTRRQKERNPAFVAPLYDSEEAALLQEVENRKTRKQTWF